MKKTTVFILNFIFSIYHSSLFAGGFKFIPQKSLTADEIEIIQAKVKVSTSGLEYICLVDTGARFTLFKENLLKDFPKIGEIVGGGISNSSQVTDLVKVDIDIGGWKKTKAPIGRTNRIPFDCLIGNDFFMNRIFKIDFNLFEITDIDSFIKNEKSFPLNVYKSDLGGHFGFEVTLGNKTVETIFDTGATDTVVSLSLVKQNPEHFKLIKEIEVTDGNNSKLTAGLYELDEIYFGETLIKNFQVYALDLTNLKLKIPSIEIVIGLNWIQKFNWQFDMKNQLYFYNLK